MNANFDNGSFRRAGLLRNCPFRGCNTPLLRLFACVSPRPAKSGRNSAVRDTESPRGDHQIGQTEQRVQPRRVLGQPAIADLLQTKQILDDVKRMLDLGLHGLDRRQKRRLSATGIYRPLL